MVRLHNRYELELRIAEGSYGIVYKAFDIKTNKYVAIKLIDNCMRSKFETISAIKEICILNSLKNTHNNIINIQDYFINGNDIILVFEYIDNTLQNLIINPSKRYNYTHIKHIMFKLLKTLEFLHDNFIIHRDIRY